MPAWIIWAIRYLPTIIALVKAIISAIDQLDGEEKKGAAAQLDQAMGAVKESGDLGRLQDLGNRLGVGDRMRARRQRKRGKQ